MTLTSFRDPRGGSGNRWRSSSRFAGLSLQPIVYDGYLVHDTNGSGWAKVHTGAILHLFWGRVITQNPYQPNADCASDCACASWPTSQISRSAPRSGWYRPRQIEALLYRYGAPKVALSLKNRMVKAEAIDALWYGCNTWTLRQEHYAKPRTVHHRVLLRIIGAQRKIPHHRMISYNRALEITRYESFEITLRTRRLFVGGSAHSNERRAAAKLNRVRVQCGEDGVEGERVDRLRTERHPGVWHSGGLESDGIGG